MSAKEVLKKFMNGEMSYDQVIEFSNSLPPDEAISFRITFGILVKIIGPKIAEIEK